MERQWREGNTAGRNPREEISTAGILPVAMWIPVVRGSDVGHGLKDIHVGRV